MRRIYESIRERTRSKQECTSCPPADTTQAHAPALLSTEQAATSPYSSTPAVASARDAQLMAAPVRARA